ncbi:hypothetical protein JTP77_024840 [Streptomyces sp. S9]|nr:hypothetical protein [Streptomyces sp. S9]
MNIELACGLAVWALMSRASVGGSSTGWRSMVRKAPASFWWNWKVLNSLMRATGSA